MPSVPLTAWAAELWRIQDGPQLQPKVYPTPRFRFDAVAGEYPAVYEASDPVDAFAEVYRGRNARLGRPEARRYLCRIAPRSPLPLVDFRDHAVLVALGLDERISVGDDYVACQAWALAFYRASSDIMGLCYRSRLAGVLATNVVLFADRAAAHLDVVPEGRLRDLEIVVMAAADRFGLTVLFPFD